MVPHEYEVQDDTMIERKNRMLAFGFLLLAVGLILLASQLDLTGFVSVDEAQFNITISKKVTICSFFIINQSHVEQNSTAIFRFVVRNCGSVPFYGSTTFYVNNSGSVKVYEASLGNYSLALNGVTIFNAIFEADFPLGNYTATAATLAVNGSLSDYLEVTVPFEVVPATVPAQDVVVIVSVPSGGGTGTGGGGGGAPTSDTSRVDTIVRLNITLPKDILNVTHNTMLPVEAIVENLGTQKVTNISIIPLLDSRWNYTSASLDILGPKERQKRTFGILPFDTVETKIHMLPIGVYVGGALYQVVYLVVDVKPSIPPYARLRIMEYEYSIHLQTDSERVMSYLVKNTGTLPLTHITTRLENFESCFQSVRYGTGHDYLDINQTAIIEYRVRAAAAANNCNVTLISVSSEGGTDVKIIEVFVEEEGELFERIISGIIDFLRWLFELIMEIISATLKFISSLFR